MDKTYLHGYFLVVYRSILGKLAGRPGGPSSQQPKGEAPDAMQRYGGTAKARNSRVCVVCGCPVPGNNGRPASAKSCSIPLYVTSSRPRPKSLGSEKAAGAERNICCMHAISQLLTLFGFPSLLACIFSEKRITHAWWSK